MHSAARRFGFALISITLAFGLAACGGDSPDSGQPQASTISKADCGQVDADGVVTITSANDDFDIPCIVAPAGQAFVIRLVNTDGLPHDMQIFTDSSRNVNLYKGGYTLAGQTMDYEIPALDAGTYYYLCTLHTQKKQNGPLYVE